MFALAYHITWTTYGTWLPGDERGWVRKNTTGIQEPNAIIAMNARKRMKENPVHLSSLQRGFVECTIRQHCLIRGWLLQAVNVRSNHIHVVVTAGCDADEVMKQLKAWCSRKLSDAADLKQISPTKSGRKRWFTEGGNRKLIHTEQYLDNAIQYVLDGQ